MKFRISSLVVTRGVSRLRTGVKVLAGGLAVLAVWVIAGQVRVGASSTLGTIKGLGSAGFISKFLDNYTIVSSGIFENQGNVGIGTTNPQSKLDVLGGVRIDGAGNGLTFADGSSVYNRASLIGAQGPQGLQGAPGINGTNGTNGAPGPPGPSGMSHIWIDREVGASVSGTDTSPTTVATVTVPVGSYIVIGKTSAANFDGNDQLFTCRLDQGSPTSINLAGVSGSNAHLESILVLGAFTASGTITMTCNTPNGGAQDTVLTAIAVDAIN